MSTIINMATPTRFLGLAVAAAAGAIAATTPSAATTAQPSVTSLFLPGFDQQSLVASVITAAPEATQFLVKCGAKDPSDCGVGNGMTLLEGPFTFSFSVGDSGVDIAACSYSVGGTEATEPTAGTETATDIKHMYLPVTITAGLQKLAGITPITALPTTATPTSTSSAAATNSVGSGGGRVAAATANSVNSAAQSGATQIFLSGRVVLGLVAFVAGALVL